MLGSKSDKSLYAWALVRISIGFIFLWAFFDKLFGLGFATCRDGATDLVHTGCSAAWAQGGSPTAGFLGHAVSGPFANVYHNLSGKSWVDLMFMTGLLVVGLGLFFGLWTKIASLIGMLILLLLWSALLWPAQNPFVDEHIVYIFALWGVYVTAAKQPWSMHKWWGKTGLVKIAPFLK